MDSLYMGLEEVGKTLSDGAKGVGKGTSLVSRVERQGVSEKFGQLRDELGLDTIRNKVVSN